MSFSAPMAQTKRRGLVERKDSPYGAMRFDQTPAVRKVSRLATGLPASPQRVAMGTSRASLLQDSNTVAILFI